MQRYQELLDSKLAHYNAWMRNASLGEIYPGFPEQGELDVLCGVADPVVVVAEPAPKHVKAAKAAKPSEGKTKLERARELFAAAPDKSRAAIIALFIAELGMTKSGASTYFYSAQQ